MQIQGVQRDLLPGDPVCAPSMTVMSEAFISLLKSLHKNGAWTDVINDKITTQLDKVKEMEALKTDELLTVEDGGKEKGTNKGKEKLKLGEEEQTGKFYGKNP